MGKLDERVILIGGGAGGMGRAEAELFVAEGAKVVIGDVDVEAGVVVATALGEAAAFASLDTSSGEDWSRAVTLAVGRFGKLDGLVNHAGI